MYLCHKCGGLLASDKTEDATGLLGCECVSGYLRGSEPNLNREQAIKKQMEHQKDWIKLYMRQNRSHTEISVALNKLTKLEGLK